MSPYLTIPAIVTNTDNTSKEIPMRVQPNEIEYYYPGIIEGTVVVMKSGHSWLTPLPTKQFDELLVTYHEFKRQNAGTFGVLNFNQQPKSKLHVSN